MSNTVKVTVLGADKLSAQLDKNEERVRSLRWTLAELEEKRLELEVQPNAGSVS